jgi:hypothetical protein
MIGNGKCTRFPGNSEEQMSNEPLNNVNRTTPSGRDENNVRAEHTEPDTPAEDTKTAEDVKADAEIEDRFEATDN